MDRIASDLHISVSTVNRAIKELVAAGFIEKENRSRTYNKKTFGKTSNLYTVHTFD
jgi:predicted transcriptional regulator